MSIMFFHLAAVALLGHMVLGGNLYAFSLSLKTNQVLTEELIQEVPKSFFVTKIVSLVPGYSCAEIGYLLALTTPGLCDKQQLITGIDRLRMQSPTMDITISLKEVADGYALCVDGKQEWTVGRIKYRGMSFATEEYGMLYDSAPGELFSEERHKASLALIQKAAQEKGYLNTSVEAQLEYHQETKLVDITIKILQKDVYKIKTIQLVFERALSGLSAQDRTLIYKKFFARFIKKPYNTKDIEICFKDLKRYLSELGCITSTLRIQETIDKQEHVVDLVITLGCSERRELQFFGNHFFSIDQLRAVIMQFGNEAGILPPLVMCQELQDAYHKKGFWQAQVETHQDQDADYFIIKEGPRASIKNSILKGLDYHEQKNCVEKFFKKTIKGKPFDESSMDAALESMIAWYKEAGYMDIAILKKEWQPTEKPNFFNAVITIDKGVCYTVTSLTLVAMPAELEDVLEKLLPECPFPLSFEKLGTLKKKILHALRKAGYAQATLSTHMDLQDATYAVTYTLNAGPLLRVGKIIVKGPTQVRHDVIRSLVTSKTGDLWSKEKLQMSFGAIKSTDVFERIGLQPVFSKTGNERDILVSVQDDEPFEAKVRLGFEQLSKNFAFKKGSSYTAGGTFLWKNPTGQADKVSFDLDMSRFERKVVLAYKTPFFISIPINSTLKGYSNRYTQPVAIGSIDPLYKVTQEGFLCGLSKHFDHYDVGLTTGLEWMLINDISDVLSRTINFKTTLVGEHIPYFFAEPMLYIDYVDNRLSPTKGTFAALTLKGMFPLKSEATYFVKGIIENGWFVPCFECVWATRIRIGHIFKQTFNTVMPPERFYLGGPNSLRGYQVDKCPPLGSYVDDEGQVQWLQQGGKTMVNFNTELRFPLFYNPIQGVVFQDFGVLVERPQDLMTLPDKPLAATGFGLRYATPIGPLRFDIGWKWYQDHPDDPLYAWFLTFDHMF